MRNPHKWAGPTPQSHDGKNDKSGGEHWDSPTPNGEQSRPHRGGRASRPYGQAATSAEATPRSSKPGLGNPYPRKSDRKEMKSSPAGMNMGEASVPASGPEPKFAVGEDPKKWQKRNYSMDVPTDDRRDAPPGRNNSEGTRKKHRAIG